MNCESHISTIAYYALGDQIQSTLGTAVTEDYYDGDGNLTASIDADGNLSTYFYDADGNLTLEIQGVNSLSPSATSFAYDHNGNQTLVVTGAGTSVAESTSYACDANGNQTLTITGYGTPQAATTISKYDGDGNLTQQIDADDNTSDFLYDSLGDQTQAIEGVGTPQQAATEDYYDGNGNLTESIDADGNTTSYYYDPDSNLTLQVQGYGTAAASTTSFAYDADGNETLTIVGYGTADAEATYYGYDVNGNQTLTITGYGTPQAATTTSQYDGDGNLIKQTDPDGNVSNYSYDFLGDQIQSTLGTATTTDSYDGNGNLTLSIDPDGDETAYQYDADGNLTLEIQGYGSPSASETSFAYDADGNQTLVVAGALSATPESTYYGYDANGNQTLTITGYGTSQAATTTSQYDGDGNLTKQMDPDGNVSDYAYDPLGDQTLSIVGAGSSNPGTTHDSYDGNGNLTLTVNAVGDSTSFQYDPDGNQTLEIDGYGTSSAATIHYLYDADGNQTEEVDPDGNTTSYEYDADGNQTLMIQAVGTSVQASTSYQYDKDGNLTLQTNPNGTSIESSYNDQGEVTSETWYTGSTVTNNLSYTYDPDGNMLTASNDSGSYTFGYNADGEETIAIDPNGVTLDYQYDADGNVTQITDSLGDTVTSLYDANGDLTQRSATGPNGAQIAEDLTYDDDGNPISVERYGQVDGSMQFVGGETETYDAQGNLTYIVQADASGNTLDSFSYSYDAAGELIQEVDYNTGTTDYSYDATGQLISAGSTAYSYDANGNPDESGDTVGPNNELLSDGTWDYSYDANGNNTGKVGVAGGPDAGLTWTYSYDTANELIEATETNSQGQTLEQASYTYGVFGNMISSSVSINGGTAVVTHYAYNDSTLWATETASNVIEDLYVSGNQPDQYFAQIEASAGAAWYLTDDLGSVRDLMNNSGQLTDVMTYDAYGNEVSQTNPSATPEIGFTGFQIVAGLGVYQAGIRDYNPQTEQWMQQDSILTAAGPNTYEYVNDDPTNMVDSTGESGTWTEGWMDKLAEQDPMVYQYLQSGQGGWNISETSGGWFGGGNRTKEFSVKDGVLHIYIGQNYSQEEALTYIRSVVRQQPGFDAFDTPERRAAVNSEVESQKAYQQAVEMTPSRPFNAVQNARDLAAAQPDWSEEDIFLQNVADEQAARNPDRAAALEQAADAADGGKITQAWNAYLAEEKQKGDERFWMVVEKGGKLIQHTAIAVMPSMALSYAGIYLAGDDTEQAGEALLEGAAAKVINVASEKVFALLGKGWKWYVGPTAEAVEKAAAEEGALLAPKMGSGTVSPMNPPVEPPPSPKIQSDYTYPTGPRAGEPAGIRTVNKANASSAYKRGIELENQSADSLAKAGYRVEQNPTVPGSKNPDFLIEGRVFDNYAPQTSDERSIVNAINRKVGEGQADRIVLNLADSNVTRHELREALSDCPISRFTQPGDSGTLHRCPWVAVD